MAESDSSSDMYTTGELNVETAELPPQTQQGFTEPTLDTYVHCLQTQYRETESDSSHSTPHQTHTWPHTAQGLSVENAESGS